MVYHATHISLLSLQIVDLITNHVPLYLGVSCGGLADDMEKLTAYFTVCYAIVSMCACIYHHIYPFKLLGSNIHHVKQLIKVLI